MVKLQICFLVSSRIFSGVSWSNLTFAYVSNGLVETTNWNTCFFCKCACPLSMFCHAKDLSKEASTPRSQVHGAAGLAAPPAQRHPCYGDPQVYFWLKGGFRGVTRRIPTLWNRICLGLGFNKHITSYWFPWAFSDSLLESSKGM